MSYSFNFTAATKASAKSAFDLELAKIAVNGQPAHAREMHAVCAAAHALIDTLEDDLTKNIYVSANGSVGWNYQNLGYQTTPDNLTNASFAFTAYLVDKPTPDASVSGSVS